MVRNIPSNEIEISPVSRIFAKVGSKFCQILNKPAKNRKALKKTAKGFSKNFLILNKLAKNSKTF